jgi:thiamine pyrophosphokinase
MIIKIVAGGPVSLVPVLRRSDDEIWIGVDSGVLTLLQNDVVPEFAFGDFDSLSTTAKKQVDALQVRQFSFQKEKDQTDLELAIDWAIEQNPDEIVLYGATGGRLDHGTMNIQLLLKGIIHHNIIKMIDIQNTIQLFQPGVYEVINQESYTYISFLPFSECVENLSLSGFKYPLEKETIRWGSSLCISNELAEKSGTYSFTNGILMMIKSKDL